MASNTMFRLLSFFTFITINYQQTQNVKKHIALRSAALGDLVTDTSISDFGQHSFSVAAPTAWNELPDSLRNIRTV